MSETVFVTPSSSNLSETRYLDETNDLYITFKNGDEYVYRDVPFDVFRGLMHARSAGQYFIANIKDVYDYERV